MGELKVALVNPPDPYLSIRSFPVFENLGLALVAAYLRQDGFTVHIVDGFADDLAPDAVAARVLDFAPDLVGFACTHQSYDNMLKIAVALRERLPQAHLTIGSEHATYAAHEILLGSPLDSVVRGEGEETMLDLARALASSRPLQTVAGIFFRSGNEVVENPARPSIKDIDTLPFAARDTLGQAASRGKPVLIGMLGSRGCYSKCSFCNAHQFFRLGGGKAVRRRSPKSIVLELAQLYENHVRGLVRQGIDASITFYDATFIPPDKVSKKWAREIAEGLIERGIRIPFRAYVRADSFTDKDVELIGLLKQAGLRSVFVGFDSGSDELQEAYDKGASVEQNMKTVRMLKRFGIYGVANGFIMFGPYSTLDTLRSNVDFLVASDQAHYSTMSLRMQLYPGLRLIEILEREGLLLPERSPNGLRQYAYRDPRAGLLAQKAAFYDEPLVKRESALVRSVRNIRSKVDALLAAEGIADAAIERHGDALDEQWRAIGQLNGSTFHRFIDLAESGWSDEAFSAQKSHFLSELEARLDRLEESYNAYLAYLHEELPGRFALAMPGIPWPPAAGAAVRASPLPAGAVEHASLAASPAPA
jgi:radical SAM superfamily enzyme YgiQ (UPF0313 family)